MTLNELIRDYCKAHGKKVKTFLGNCEVQFRLVFGKSMDRDIRDLFTADAAGRFGEKIRSRYMANRQSHAKERFMSLWDWAFSHKMVPDYPAGGQWIVDREIRKAPRAYTLDEMQRMFAAIDKIPSWLPHRKARATALLAILYFTGVRGKHLLELKPEHLDVSAKTLAVVNTKSEIEQVFILDEDVVDVIVAGIPKFRVHERYGFLLAHRTHGQMAADLNKIKQAAGIPVGDSRQIHAIRKSTATHIAMRAGVKAAAEHLGHSNTDMTLNYYIDPRQMPVRSHCIHLDTSIMLAKDGD